MKDELVNSRPLNRLLDCFLRLVPDGGGKAVIALRRLPTEKELTAAADVVGEMEYREQMDNLDRRRK